jgi:hypothetical protein
MRQLFIDSRDRVSGGTSSNFTIQLNQTLVLQNNKGRITNLRIPMSIPTVQSGINDTIVIQMGASSYTITLPQQNYDSTTLPARIQSLLVAAIPGSWTVTYDTNNISMSISCSNNFTITGGTYAAQLLSRPYTQTSNSYKFSYVPLNGADVIYLCGNLTNSNKSFGSQGSHDTLLAVNVTCGYGSVLDASMDQGIWFDIPDGTYQNLSFQLRDRSYNILNIVPNISFTVAIV